MGCGVDLFVQGVCLCGKFMRVLDQSVKSVLREERPVARGQRYCSPVVAKHACAVQDPRRLYWATDADNAKYRTVHSITAIDRWVLLL